MPSTTVTFEQIRKILADVLGFDRDEITSEAKLAELGIDSCDMSGITWALEDKFNIEIARNELFPDDPTKRVGQAGNHLPDHINNYTVSDLALFVTHKVNPTPSISQ